MPAYSYRILPEYVSGHGRVSLSGITKLFQRAATQHSDDLGYTSSWFRSNDCVWMTRRHRVTPLDTIQPDDTIRIRTHVEDMKGIRSLRTYNMVRESTDEIVAEGYTDWVYLDRTTHSPKRIPESMIEAFDPEFENRSPNRIDFDSPEMSQDTFDRRYQVQYRDLDEIGHVNNVVYVDYLTETLTDYLEETGAIDSFSDIDPVPSRLLIQYLGQATRGDTIRCELDPEQHPDGSIHLSFAISTDSERLVEGSADLKTN